MDLPLLMGMFPGVTFRDIDAEEDAAHGDLASPVIARVHAYRRSDHGPGR